MAIDPHFFVHVFRLVTAQENPTVSDLHYQLSSKPDQNSLLEARDTQKPF